MLICMNNAQLKLHILVLMLDFFQTASSDFLDFSNCIPIVNKKYIISHFLLLAGALLVRQSLLQTLLHIQIRMTYLRHYSKLLTIL